MVWRSFSHPGAAAPRSRCPCWIYRLFHRTSCLCPFCLTALLQWSVVLSYDKVWDVFRWKQEIHFVFRRIQKIRTLLLLEKSSDFVVVVHLQGLEPWAHWLREQAAGSSQFMEVSSHRYFQSKQRDFSPGNFCTLCRILQRKAPSARFETVQNPCRNRALTLWQTKSTYPPSTWRHWFEGPHTKNQV